MTSQHQQQQAAQGSRHVFRRWLFAADSGLVVNLDDRPREQATDHARQLAGLIREHSDDGSFAGVRDLVPGLTNLLIQYDSLVTEPEELIRQTEPLLEKLGTMAAVPARCWEMPVIYGGAYGPDLEDVSATLGLTEDEVVSCHQARELEVSIMGFLPGLGYLTGMDEVLALPRRSSPRQKVPPRSVAIAMTQSVIYPLESPGGWHLLGRVPFELFDPRRDEPVLLRPGDRIRFYAVSEAEFLQLEEAAANGTWQIMPQTQDVGKPS